MTPDEAIEAAGIIRQIQSLRADIKVLGTVKSGSVLIPQLFNPDRTREGTLTTPLGVFVMKNFLQEFLATHIARLKQLGVDEPKPFSRFSKTSWEDDEE